MHALIRSLTTSLGILFSGMLVSLTAQAQTDPEQPYQAEPGYQQPEPSYQQPPQAYSQQQYPQQGYVQPQGYPTAQTYPPQGYYAPAPSYPQQPAYRQPSYAPAPAYAAEPPYRVGYLWMPYIGVNIPTGAGSENYSAGLRLGALFGINLPPFLSLNGELTFDLLNPDYGSGDYTEMEYDITFSPLFHFRIPQLEFVVGPKFGYFGRYVSYDNYYATSADFSQEGYAYGINAGAFFPLGRIAIGGLFNFTGRHLKSECDVNDNCYHVTSTSDAKFIAFSLALLY